MADDSVNITITATTAQMRAELALAQAQTKALNAEVAGLAKQMVATGASTDAALGSALAAASTEAAASAGRVKELEQSLKAADGALSGMHVSVPTATREFRALFDELSSGRTHQTPGTLALLATRVFGLGPAALAAVGGIAALAGGLAYLAYEVEQADKAAEAGKDAFAFKDVQTSDEEIKSLTQTIFNFSGSSEKATAAVLRSFASITDATPALREELARLIPAYQKATGEDVQKSGEALAGIFSDLAKNGEKFLQSLAKTPATTQALNDFNEAISHGDRADAERIVLEQLSAAVDRVGQVSKESEGWFSKFNEALVSAQPNAAEIKKAFDEDAEALKNLSKAAQDAPTLTPKVASSNEEFTAQLASLKDNVAETNSQIINSEIASYNRRIAELKSFGQSTVAEERARAQLIAEAQRSASSEAVATTRQEIAQEQSATGQSQQQQLQEAVAAWTRLLASHKLTADEEIAVEREKDQAITALHREEVATEQGIAKSNADAQIVISRYALEEQKQNLDLDLQAHKITADRQYEISQQLMKDEARLDTEEVQNEMKTYQQGTVAYQDAANKIREIEAKLNADLAGLARQHLADVEKSQKQESAAWQGTVRLIESAEQGFVQSIFSGRQSLSQSLIQLALRSAEGEIAADLKAVTTRLLLSNTEATQSKALEQGGILYHLLAEQQKTAATATGSTTRTALESQSHLTFLGQIVEMVAGWLGFETDKTASAVEGAAAEATASATGIAAAKAQGLAYAGEAGAAAMASVAAIPIIGWAMAPEVGAETFATAAGFASAAGGMYEVPTDGTMIMAHAEESVMPASIANPMRDFFESGGESGTSTTSGSSGGGASSGGGNGGLAVYLTVQAFDTQTGAQFLKDNVSTIATALAGQLRIGSNTLRAAAQPS